MLNKQSDEVANTLSIACGWLYFVAWSLSFYPQIILNWRRRTTAGLTPDFSLLNIFGFSCYTISNAALLYSSTVRKEYASRHPKSPEPTVRINDLAFGIHALTLCMIVYSQFYPRLWGFKPIDAARRKATRVSLGLIWGGSLAVAILVILALAGGKASNWGWLDVVYSFSHIKLLLTIFKYLPQAISNFRRKSTIGWSITQQLLDFTGGVLSLLQIVIDGALQADWSGLTGNPIKFGLGIISVLFDILFILQHFVLFGPVPEKGSSDEENADSSHGRRQDGERQPLLSG